MLALQSVYAVNMDALYFQSTHLPALQTLLLIPTEATAPCSCRGWYRPIAHLQHLSSFVRNRLALAPFPQHRPLDCL